MEKLGKEGYEESSSETESEANEEKQESAEKKPPRKILRAKKQALPSSQPAGEAAAEESKVAVSKKRPARVAKTAAAKRPASPDSESDDSEEEKVSSGPQIGKKRKNPATSSSNDMPTKRIKRNANGSEEVKVTKKQPVKKVAAKPTEFKAGKWNPSTVLLEEDIELCGKMEEPDFDCCKLCNLKNLHRAVDSNNAKLLEKLVVDKKNINNMLQE